MTFRVKLTVALVFRFDDMIAPRSVQPTDVSAEDPAEDQENVSKQLLKNIDEIYSPVLKLLRLFGLYLGDTSLKRLAHTSGHYRQPSILAIINCCVMIAGFWINVVMAIVAIFYGDDVYTFILFSLWCVLIALNATLCLFVLCVPFNDTRKSRFGYFLMKLCSINTTVSLEKIKTKSTKGIIVFGFVSIFSTAGILMTSLLLKINVAYSEPWSQWPGFQIVSVIFLIVGCGPWFLPVLFYCITCCILQTLLEDLHQRISPLRPFTLNLTAFRMEHRKLCEVVEFADRMLRLPMFGMVSVYLPLICFNFHLVINSSPGHKFVSHISTLIFFLFAVCTLAIIMVFGSKVNEQVK